MTRKKRSIFSPEFTLESAQLVVDQNYSVRQAAEAVNVRQSKNTGSTINWWPILLGHYINFIFANIFFASSTCNLFSSFRYSSSESACQPIHFPVGLLPHPHSIINSSILPCSQEYLTVRPQ
jgi:hypothetical protein